jgi:hypothetical protein
VTTSPVLAEAKEEEQVSYRWVRRTVVALCLFAAIFSICAMFIGFHSGIFDFRESQTALDIESIARGDGFLNYQTPVLGPPWTIPFEFPLYQGLVAGSMHLFGTRLEETGRAVSIFFFYLCFFPLSSILRLLRFKAIQIIPTLAILSVSPLYILYSRGVWIESTVLFLSLMYVEQMLRLTNGELPWQYRHIAGATVFGVLAGLVKVTTYAPYWLLGVGLVAWQLWKQTKSGKIRISQTASAALLCGLLPVVMTEIWTKYADNLKTHSPLSIAFTSKALTQWTFGTLAQRLQPRWYHLLESRVHIQIGYTAATVLIVGVFIGLMVSAEPAARLVRYLSIAAVCAALYAAAVLLFFNLHAAHEYYSCANAVCLIAGIGVLLAAMLDLPGRKAWIGAALLAIQLGASIGCYVRDVYREQLRGNPGQPELAAIVDRTTSPQSVILITGMDWSPTLVYQAGRRAIMDKGFGLPGHFEDLGAISKVIELQGPGTIAAVVACNKGKNADRLPALLQMVEMTNPAVMQSDDCDVYERPAAAGVAAP